MEHQPQRERRPRRSFDKEYKAKVVALVRSGRSVTEVARDLDLTRTAVGEWVKQADIDDGHREGLTTAERLELAELRKENRVLREEREILKKAAAYVGDRCQEASSPSLARSPSKITCRPT